MEETPVADSSSYEHQPGATQEAEHIYQPTLKDFLIPAGIIAFVLLADQLLKFWVKYNMNEFNYEIPLLGNWFKLHFTENNGIAFGYEMGGRGGKLTLTLFRLLASGLIMYYLIHLIRRGTGRGFVISVALIFAGAMGNIIDSVFYGVWFNNGMNDYEGGYFHGKVVDMLYMPIWRGHFPSWMPAVGGDEFEFFRPVFNLADSSITIGVLLIFLFFRKALK